MARVADEIALLLPRRVESREHRVEAGREATELIAAADVDRRGEVLRGRHTFGCTREPGHGSKARSGDEEGEQRRHEDAQPPDDQQRGSQIRDRRIDVVDVRGELDRFSVRRGGAGDAKMPAAHVRVPEREPDVAACDRHVDSTQGNRDGLIRGNLAAPVCSSDSEIVAGARGRQVEVRQRDLGVRELGEPRRVGAQRVVGLIVQPVTHGEIRDHGGQDHGDRYREHTEQREPDAEAHCSRST